MILQHAFTLPVPMEDAFDLLVDASAVGDALPGARPASLGATDGTLVVEGLLDGEAVTLRGRVAPLERDRAAGALSFHATADDGSGGRAIAAGAVRLRDAGGLTAVAIQLDLETAGRLQAVTTEAIEAAVHRLVDGLAAGLRARAGGSQPPGDEPDGEDAGAVTSGGTAEAVGSPVRGEATGVAVPVPDLLEAASEHWETIGYAWMTDAMGPAVTGHRPAAAPPFAALGELPPPPRRREARRVPGRVEIVTVGPLPVAGIPVGDSPAARLNALQRDRPWLAPAMAMSAIALVLLLRRREERA